MVIVGYGQIIPQSIIDIAPLGIINVHASLLPELRGAAPIQWSIVRGYEKTGVTTMRIDAGLDTGDIALKWETPDRSRRNRAGAFAATGRRRCRSIAPNTHGLASGALKPVPQDGTRATWRPILKKEDGCIDWTLPAKTIHNLIRGLQPWPGAFTMFRGQSLHLWRSRLVATKWNLAPGALVQDHGVFAVAGDGACFGITGTTTRGP